MTFVRSGVGPNKATEFHAVLEHEGGAPVVSDVRTRLFDRMGLQTALVKLGKEHAGSAGAGAGAELRPDETRTYSGSIPAERDAESRYFMIEVRWTPRVTEALVRVARQTAVAATAAPQGRLDQPPHPARTAGHLRLNRH